MAFKANYKVLTKADKTKKLREAMESFRGSFVSVGVHEDAGQYETEEGKEPVPVYKVAWWLEHGTQNMPARPWFAPTIAHYRDKIGKLKAKGYAEVAFGGISVRTSLARLGFAVQSWLQNTVKANVPPALTKPYLKARRKRFPNAGDRTLIASGLLLRSIRYKTFVNGEVAVGPPNMPEPAKPIIPDKAANAVQREAARQMAAARKAREGFQKLIKKFDKEGIKSRFDAQRRAFKTFKPRKPKAPK